MDAFSKIIVLPDNLLCQGAGVRLQDQRPGAGGVYQRVPKRRGHR